MTEATCTVIDGCIEEDGEGMTLGSMAISASHLETYVGTWLIALSVRYSDIRIQRTQNGCVVGYLATNEIGTVAFLSINGVMRQETI